MGAAPLQNLVSPAANGTACDVQTAGVLDPCGKMVQQLHNPEGSTYALRSRRTPMQRTTGKTGAVPPENTLSPPQHGIALNVQTAGQTHPLPLDYAAASKLGDRALTL